MDVHCKTWPPSAHRSSQPELVNTTSVHLFLYNLFGSASNNTQSWGWGQILSNVFLFNTTTQLLFYGLRAQRSTLKQPIKINDLHAWACTIQTRHLWVTTLTSKHFGSSCWKGEAGDACLMSSHSECWSVYAFDTVDWQTGYQHDCQCVLTLIELLNKMESRCLAKYLVSES